jgi:hypothetical protein
MGDRSSNERRPGEQDRGIIREYFQESPWIILCVQELLQMRILGEEFAVLLFSTWILTCLRYMERTKMRQQEEEAELFVHVVKKLRVDTLQRLDNRTFLIWPKAVVAFSTSTGDGHIRARIPSRFSQLPLRSADVNEADMQRIFFLYDVIVYDFEDKRVVEGRVWLPVKLQVYITF